MTTVLFIFILVMTPVKTRPRMETYRTVLLIYVHLFPIALMQVPCGSVITICDHYDESSDKSPWFNPSILQHGGIGEEADEKC
jgi:hypothetical protein